MSSPLSPNSHLIRKHERRGNKEVSQQPPYHVNLKEKGKGKGQQPSTNTQDQLSGQQPSQPKRPQKSAEYWSRNSRKKGKPRSQKSSPNRQHRTPTNGTKTATQQEFQRPKTGNRRVAGQETEKPTHTRKGQIYAYFISITISIVQEHRLNVPFKIYAYFISITISIVQEHRLNVPFKISVCTPMRDVSLVVARGHFSLFHFLANPDGTLVPRLPPPDFSGSGYFSGDFDPRSPPSLGGISSGGLRSSPPRPTNLKRTLGPKIFVCTPMRDVSLVVPVVKVKASPTTLVESVIVALVQFLFLLVPKSPSLFPNSATLLGFAAGPTSAHPRPPACPVAGLSRPPSSHPPHSPCRRPVPPPASLAPSRAFT
ncbi:hypothetical protein M5K25_007353 [Dendrobium thyrsiflorum]|uniref:Uncharacterized protein n=1 Tax=Dendrobium thyrsiflorum TaxID=117978 RepID=A0ABD0VL14_DENTH